MDADQLRVFVSYSREDAALVERIVDHLRQLQIIQPFWDRDLVVGRSFRKEITNHIARSHIFMPILTETSKDSTWMHQETGYALGLSIPILVLKLANVEAGLPDDLQHLSLFESPPDLESLLTVQCIRNVVSDAQSEFDPGASSEHRPLYERIIRYEQRSERLAALADEIQKLGEYGHVRQLGELSCFSMPKERDNHPIWKQCLGKDSSTEHTHHWQRRERMAIERHALHTGCSLIIRPALHLKRRGAETTCCRMGVLVEFLERMKDVDQPIRVAISLEDECEARNLFILGNWFSADAHQVRESVGYVNTLITRHAPTIMNQIEEFEEEFDKLTEEARVFTRSEAIQELRRLTDEWASGGP